MDHRPSVPAPPEGIAATRAWSERAVIGLNLCPFARDVCVGEEIRYVVGNAQAASALLRTLSVH
jgi:hypothetical protein